ncbi:hypothetical protein D5Q48_03535 [Salmonella enterica subsp. enterica serovar Larochelle]|nr:hypothetical protein [Salmonella enterica subsp. enterica serovar Virchow]EBG5619598.1 hypothetical protein [Salmonella enterica subsp. enterica serovar Enteritidis]EBV0422848.1 hypothetical protein [Salmonella enterica subsp. enterica serovar Typhimurium]EBY9725001.1 hypothetical protein [Salmonella enterica subsp. enterica serovar Larochelle]ECB7139988.1 hypothetical protein [Salmonella enterica subsp. enterica serovar Braenderup]ECD7026999.1 hypothetical protein [Salmonella enterica subs
MFRTTPAATSVAATGPS